MTSGQRQRTFTFSSDNFAESAQRSASWIVTLSLTGLVLWAGAAFAQDLRCRPQKLYKGETLTVELPMPHKNWEFAIMDWQTDELMVSFNPGPKDQIAPVILPGDFAKMKRMKIVTTEARGSISGSWHGTCVPRVQSPPKPIFTYTGIYEVMLQSLLGYMDDVGFEACLVSYFDYPRPKNGEKIPPPEPQPPGSEMTYSSVTPMATPSVLNCRPSVLYKGDTLRIDLPEPHDKYELGVSRADAYPDTMLITYEKTPVDKIDPAIPFETFRRMDQLQLVTTETRGSRAGPPDRPCFARVFHPREPVFTRSGDYEIQIGSALGSNDPEYFGACTVHYVDHQRTDLSPR